MIIFLKALLLRRIHCIGGFQPLLGECPTHSPIFFPAPSIPSSTVGLGDERRRGGCTITHLGSTSFCCLLSFPSPLLLPGIQQGVQQWCWGLCASHPRVHGSMGRGGAWPRLPSSPSLHPALAQCFSAEDSMSLGMEGLREYGICSGLQWFTVLPLLCRSSAGR